MIVFLELGEGGDLEKSTPYEILLYETRNIGAFKSGLKCDLRLLRIPPSPGPGNDPFQKGHKDFKIWSVPEFFSHSSFSIPVLVEELT